MLVCYCLITDLEPNKPVHKDGDEETAASGPHFGTAPEKRPGGSQLMSHQALPSAPH